MPCVVCKTRICMHYFPGSTGDGGGGGSTMRRHVSWVDGLFGTTAVGGQPMSVDVQPTVVTKGS